MADAEQAIRCIYALDKLHKLMNLYDVTDEQPTNKMYISSKQIEEKLLKDIAWKSNEDDDTFCPINMEIFEEILTMASIMYYNTETIVICIFAI